MAHILLIEDSPAMLKTLELAICSKGHSVVSATNGAQGTEQLIGNRFDIVVTDILMPDIDGLALIAQISRTAPETKIIAISGGGTLINYDVLGAAKKLGAAAILEKPFPITDFYDALDSCASQ